MPRTRIEAELDGDVERADLVLVAYQGALLTWSLTPEGSAEDRVRTVVTRVLKEDAA